MVKLIYSGQDGEEAVPQTTRGAFEHAAFTRRGLARRTNDDHHCLIDRLGVFAVADGIGSSEAGGESAVQCLGHLEEQLSGAAEDDPEARLRGALDWTNGRVLAQAWRSSGRGRHYGGCCVAGVVLAEAEGRALIFHAGDSGVHRVSGGRCEPLTEAHLAPVGRNGRRSRVSSAIGLSPRPRIDIAAVPLGPGDAFLVHTDGCRFERLAEASGDMLHLADDESPADYIRRLEEMVVDSVADDDATAILVRYRGEPV